MTKWEYHVIALNSMHIGPMQEHLNALGAHGWEVVSSAVAQDPVNHTIVLKRALPAPITYMDIPIELFSGKV